jgi:cytochrome c oxidase subunit 4
VAFVARRSSLVGRGVLRATSDQRRATGGEVPGWKMSEQADVLSVRTCFLVFFALIALTAITVGAAFLDLSFLNTPLALGIASVKALLVMTYFMELRHSPRLQVAVVGTSFLFLLIMISFTMSDMISRGWLGFPGK